MAFITDHEFELNINSPFFSVPFTISDPQAYVVAAGVRFYAKTPVGQKAYIGYLIVKDRKLADSAPQVGLAWVVHRVDRQVELPEQVGAHIASFSSHGGEHHWHVFAARKEPAPAKLPAQPSASRAPTTSEPKAPRSVPRTENPQKPASGPLLPGEKKPTPDW